MENLLGFTLERMREEFLKRGQSQYRAKQVFNWIYQRGILSFDAMTDVSKAFREELKRDFCLALPTVFAKQEGSDGTIKLLLEMEDGSKVEEVMMPYDYGSPICVSSEVGCSMGCAFCASGLLKKKRGLSASEMVGELLVMNQVLSPYGLRATHINVMGTGEPFDNYDAVMDFIRIANAQEGLAPRRFRCAGLSSHPINRSVPACRRWSPRQHRCFRCFRRRWEERLRPAAQHRHLQQLHQ